MSGAPAESGKSDIADKIVARLAGTKNRTFTTYDTKFGHLGHYDSQDFLRITGRFRAYECQTLVLVFAYQQRKDNP